MSKIKRLLSEEYELGYDTLEPDTPSEPSMTDWAIADLQTNVRYLMENTPYGYMSEFKKIHEAITTILKKLEHPF